LSKRLKALDFQILKRIFQTAMPLEIVETTGLKHDGIIGVQLKDKHFILVADHAYFSIDNADRYAKTKQNFIIRLKDNIELNCKRSLQRSPQMSSLILPGH